MLTTVTGFFVLAASVTAIGSAAGKIPIWVPVICLCVVELLAFLPK